MWKLVPVSLFALALSGETITGTILIKRKLTKRSVTPAVSIYQRGSVVGLQANPVTDPLDFERSHVAIWVEGDGPALPCAADLKQSGRQFVPDMVVISAGSSVSFPNFDPIFHNVFSLSNAKSFDLGNYPKGETRSIKFPKPGIVYVNCHLHPNMAATIVVAPNQWFTRADSAGNFRIPDLPPGDYTVVAWHKTAGYFKKTIEVMPGAGAAISFFIPLNAGNDAGNDAGNE
jgi:plastocyanin